MTRDGSNFTDAKIAELLTASERFDATFHAITTGNQFGYAAALREIRASHMALGNALARASNLTKERTAALAKVDEAKEHIALLTKERDEFEMALRRSEEERARLQEMITPAPSADAPPHDLATAVAQMNERLEHLELRVLNIEPCSHASWEALAGGFRRCADCGAFLPPVPA